MNKKDEVKKNKQIKNKYSEEEIVETLQVIGAKARWEHMRYLWQVQFRRFRVAYRTFYPLKYMWGIIKI